ncbi:phosphatase PAP2 family protein [Pseudolysinimonas sp.]|uniref:phosphatase PAP2 family protein n=1 Tax=Pseudolysinimonas sp. TaxID=2680009 RepID=UPI00286C8954|nr:phosphatase PAP2 family protein [Pseudolysinimonas sp.]
MPVPASIRDLPWRRIAGIASAGGVVVVLLLGLLVRVEAIADEIDGEWMAEILEMRGPGWEAVSRVFDFLGGGWFANWLIPVVVAVSFLIARRPWAASVFVIASAVSALLVQALKVLFGRARPEDSLLELHTAAYPSGHVANAATVVVLLALLLCRWWVATAGAAYVVLMALSRTYLGAHWVTDTVGGALLGASVALAGWAILAPMLHRERQGRRASVGA